MDFFKSVFSTDPESSDPHDEEEEEEDDQDQQQEQRQEEEEQGEEASKNPNSNPNSPSSFAVGGFGGGAWNFGGLIKTISTRSESVIQTYRRDLEEFSSGLKKETAVLKEVASRAVRDLPGSLEVGASVAQESLETVGQAIDDFGGSVWCGTAEIISHGKETLLAADSDSNSPTPNLNESNSQIPGSAKRYSRFEAQVLAIQNDANTFVEEVEDGEGFEKWKLGFKLEEKEEEIEGLLYDNGTLEGFFEKFVPEFVDRQTFWARYFYRVYRLKQAEDARAKLVKRVISGEEEEELSWEVDDDDGNVGEGKEEIKENKEEKTEDGEAGSSEKKEGEAESSEKKEGGEAETLEKKHIEEAKKEVIVEEVKKEETSEPVEEKKPIEASQVENSEEVEKVKSDGDEDSSSKTESKLHSQAKSEHGESSKDSDFTVVSSQPSMQEEEDLGWDEIEDLGEHEDKKNGKSSGSPKRVDLRKKISVAEDDEDLSWDIEDDDD